MAQVFHLQSNFTLGELDEVAHARTDFEGYYKSAKRIRNMVVIPLGGAKTRFGTEFVADVTPALPASPDFTMIKVVMIEFFDLSKYTIVFIPLAMQIYFEDALVATVVTPYAADEIINLNFGFNENKVIVVHEDHDPRELIRVTAHASWTFNAAVFRFFPSYDFNRNYDAITFTPNKVSGTVTITASSPIFSAEFIGGLFVGNGGTLRLNTFNSTTVMIGDTTTDFINKNPILGTLSFLGEPAFGTVRGWPISITFYEDRQVFGGSKSLRRGIFLSAIGDYFNFDGATSNDSSAFSDFIQSEESNIIVQVLGARSLLVFTSGGEFSTPLLDSGPLTPATVQFNQQTSNGTSDIKPIIIDDSVIYVDRGGKIVRNLTYASQRASYDGTNISVLSGQLIRNPVDSAKFENPEIDDGEFFFLVNGDGTLAVYQSLRDQDVSAWSLSETGTPSNDDGLFRRVAGLAGDVYFIIERFVEGGIKFYLEKLNFNLRTDSAVVQNFASPTTTVPNLGHLIGKEVRVIGNGAVLKSKVVNVSGEIELDFPITGEVQVGLNFDPLLVPMPLNINTQTGPDLYLPKRIKSIYIDFFESAGIIVQDETVPFFQDGVDKFDEAVSPKTGVFEITNFGGWDPRGDINITQEDPLPMLIRGVGYKVDV